MAIASIQGPSAGTAAPSIYKGALATVTTLFFMWGFVTVLNDILVPHLKSIFDLNYAGVMLIQFAFFSAYFIFSIPSAKVIDWIGYKKTMVVGLFTMGLGALLFIPAASVPSYPLFLGALMVLAAGITALQVAIILSVAAKNMDAVRHMSPEELRAYRIHEASSVEAPYLIIGLVLVALAIGIAMFKLPAMPEAERHGQPIPGTSIWKHRHLVLGAVAIFLYVGAEVSIGSFLVNYFSQPEIGNVSTVVASRFVSFYWGGAMVGRFIGAAILQKVRTRVVLGVAAIAACLLVSVSMFTSGHIAMGSIILVGLFNSVMFPSIFTLGIEGLGPLTGDGSGLLVTAIVGGAIIPVVEGALADHVGIQHAFILPAICYLYIMFYAFRGSKPGVPA